MKLNLHPEFFERDRNRETNLSVGERASKELYVVFRNVGAGEGRLKSFARVKRCFYP